MMRRNWLSTLADRLSLQGIDADCVISGEIVLEKVEAETYDLSVLDVKIPRMSEIEPEKKLKEIDPDMRFLFMTGHGSDDDSISGPAEVEAEYYLINLRY